MMGIQIHSPDHITNAFGKFYANLGSNLANQISLGITKINDYLKQIPRSLNSFVMTLTTKGEVENLIKSLPNKQSCGHDRISNTMLKTLSETLSFPLTGIFNQSIIQGVFPNLMKVTEVIPLYKGKERDLVVYYKTSVMLMTISKVLEKIVYIHLYKYLEKNNTLFYSHMDLGLSDHVNMLSSN